MERFVFVDREQRQWKVVGQDTVTFFTVEEMLEGKSFTTFPCTHVFDVAHLHPKRRLSKAQVYTEEELSLLASRAAAAGVKIKGWPSKMTPQAREEYGTDNKSEDAEACFDYVIVHPELSLMNWPRVNTHLDEALADQRADMSARLNELRVENDGNDIYENAEAIRADAIFRSLIPSLSDRARKHFRVKMKKNGELSKSKNPYSRSSVMSIYVAVFNEDGTLRRNPQGNPIGKRWLWKLLKQHPFHDKGGTARSNLMWHNFRNLEKSKTNGKDKKLRADFRRSIKELARAFRDYGLREGL